jgi:uncharacterized membrane protein
MTVAYWIVAGILAAAYLAAGVMKLVPRKDRPAKDPGWVDNIPAGAITAIGALEILGAIGLILPPLTGIASVLAPIAAVGLVIVQVGAIPLHLRRGEQAQLAPNVVLLLLAIAAAALGFQIWL